MHTIPLSFEYYQQLAAQSLFICALLSGFSLTVLVATLEKKSGNGIMNWMFGSAAMATTLFLISIFAFTAVYLKTTEGYPFPVSEDDLHFPRIVGALSFFLANTALLSIVALSGWIKSKKMGWFTTILSIIALIMLLILM